MWLCGTFIWSSYAYRECRACWEYWVDWSGWEYVPREEWPWNTVVDVSNTPYTIAMYFRRSLNFLDRWGLLKNKEIIKKIFYALLDEEAEETSQKIEFLQQSFQGWLSNTFFWDTPVSPCLFFLCGGWGLNLGPCIYYALYLPIELSSRGHLLVV